MVDHWPELSPSDFSNVHLGQIFNTVLNLKIDGKEINRNAVEMEIDRPWIVGIMDQVSASNPGGAYGNICERVQFDAMRRRIADGGHRILEVAEYERNGNVAIDKAMEIMNETARAKREKTLYSLKDALPMTIKRISEPKKNRALMPTGLKDLVMPSGLVTVVAGRPGSGKSCLLLNIAANLSKSGEGVFFASLEDTSYYCQLRMISRFTGIPYKKFTENQELTFDEFKLVEGFKNQSNGWKFHIDDGSRQSVNSIRRTAMLLKARGELSVIVIDHLGQLTDEEKAYASATRNMKGISAIARDLDVPILLAHQLNRETEKGAKQNAPQMPKMSNLRDSGKIEEISRNIWLLFRPAYHDPVNSDPNQLYVLIEKATHGETGKKEKYIDLPHMAIGDRYEQNEQSY